MSDTPLRWQWGEHRLDELLRALVTQGFAAGTSETLDATRLLQRMAARIDETGAGQPGPALQTLRSALAPLLCKESDPQRRALFERLFDEWWHAGLSARVVLQALPSAPTVAAEPSASAGNARRGWLSAAAVVVAAPVIALLVVIVPPTNQPEPSLQQLPASAASAASAAELRSPVETPQPPAATGATSSASPPLDGYQPAFVTGSVLRPWLAWALVMAPLALLGLAAWWLLSALPRLASGTGGSTRQRTVKLDGWTREDLTQRLMPELDELTIGRLERHVRGTISQWRGISRRPQIDLRRTVDATLSALGVPRMRFRQALLRPSYRVMVEADKDDAPAMLWAERLCAPGADSTLWRVQTFADGSEAICHGQGAQAGFQQPFGQISAPAPGERLVLVSDGAFLLRADTSAGAGAGAMAGAGWHEWVRRARLQRWRVRAMFTPREWRLALSGPLADLDKPIAADDPGFLVLPQEDTAVAAWTHWLARGRLPLIALADRASYPRLLTQFDEALWTKELEEWPASLRGDTTAMGRRATQLMAQLQLYLGENGFYWLCCCAVPPLLRTQLSLQLGEAYLQGAGARGEALHQLMADNYRRLARLPWFVHQRMPNWVRLALLNRLPLAIQDEVRGVVERLFDPQMPKLRGDLELNFALPPGAPDEAKEGAKGETKGEGAAGEQKAAVKDALYLGFMSGINARQLALRMPGSWQRWLGELDVLSSRRARAWARLKALVLSGLFRDGQAAQGIAPRAWVVAGALSGLSVALAVLLASPGDAGQAMRAAAFEPTDELLQMRHDEVAPARANPIYGVAYSPDGQRVLSAAQSGQARLWNPNTGAPIGATMPHDSAVTFAEFSRDRDGSRILTTTAKGALRVWDGKTGQPLSRSWPGPVGLNSARLSPDGSRVLLTSNSGLAILLIDTDWRPSPTGAQHDGGALDGAFSPDGQWVVTVGADKMTLLWNATTGVVASRLTSQSPMSHVQISADGQRVFKYGADAAHVCSLRIEPQQASIDPKRCSALPVKGTLTAAAMSNDGRQIVVASAGQFQHWSELMRSDGPTYRLSNLAEDDASDKAGRIDDIVFSPDSQQFATLQGDSVRTWSARLRSDRVIAVGDALSHDARHTAELSAADIVARKRHAFRRLAFAPDSSRLLTAGSDGRVRVWADSRPQLLAPSSRLGPISLDQEQALFEKISTSSDSALAVLQGAGRLWIWRQPSGAMTELSPGDKNLDWHALSEDGKILAAMFSDGSAAAWDLSDPLQARPLAVAAEFKQPTAAEAYRLLVPDGRSVLTFSGGKVRVVPLLTGTEATAGTAGSGGVTLGNSNGQLETLWLQASGLRQQAGVSSPFLSFSRNGQRLAIASGTVLLLFDLTSGQRLVQADIPDRKTQGLWLSDDGSRVAVLEGSVISGEARQLHIYDNSRSTMTAKVTIKQPGLNQEWKSATADSVRFSPDGTKLAVKFRSLLTRSADEIGLMLFDANSGEWLNEKAPIARPLRTADFSPDSRTLAVAGELGGVGLFDAVSGQALRRWRDSERSVRALRFASDGHSLLVAGSVIGAQPAPSSAPAPAKAVKAARLIDFLSFASVAQAAEAEPLSPSRDGQSPSSQQFRAVQQKPNAGKEAALKAPAATPPGKSAGGKKASPATAPEPTLRPFQQITPRPSVHDVGFIVAQTWRVPDIGALQAARSGVSPGQRLVLNAGMPTAMSWLAAAGGAVLIAAILAGIQTRRLNRRWATEQATWTLLGGQQRETMRREAVQRLSPRAAALRKMSPLSPGHGHALRAAAGSDAK